MRCSLIAGLVVLLLMVIEVHGADPRPYGLQNRVPWTTARPWGSPDPPAPYRVNLVFPKLKFEEPLDMTSAPGTDRLFVVERYGKIFSFANEPQVAKPDLLLDMKKVVYGLAFHPQFARNGYFYVTYVLDAMKGRSLGTRVSRFRVRADDPLRADPESELILIEWPSGGHNGGCLKFGPDGFLYIATGDSSGIADEHISGQDLSDLPGSILRIDVDHPSQGRVYGIPSDNPFVDVPDARGEVWAYGLRQPWKITFDSATGDLWTGNVGQDLWEQIDLIERGGNYGWSVMEGSYPFRPERPRGPSPFIAPIVEHNHADFRSITGGFVYHGEHLSELKDAYIYGDYDTGKIWMLRYDRTAKKVTEHKELTDSTLRLVGFAEDNKGELYLLDHMQGRIFQVEKNTAVQNPADFPRRLSETGLFTSTADHAPAPFVIPYAVNAPQWCDGATKQRFFAIPGDAKIEFDGITYPQPAPGAPHGWKFPDGTVMFETLSLQMDKSDPASERRLETRVLRYERIPGTEEVGDQFWQGYTYAWDDKQQDAALVEDPYGLDRSFTVTDAAAPGGKTQQTWHFPSRSECTTCHNMAAKYALGGNTLQMNRDFEYGDVVDNQIRAFEHIGLFTAALPAAPEKLPKLADYTDESLDVNLRARSYLHANCSHCHRKWGGGNAEFRLLATIEANEMGIIDVAPAHGAWYIPKAKIVAPHDPYQSILYYRVSKPGPGRMPRIGSNVVDPVGSTLLHEWIAQLPAAQQDKPSEASLAAERQFAETLDALKTDRTATAETLQKRIDSVLQTTRGALLLMHLIDTGSLPESVRKQIIVSGTTDKAPPQVRDLFERFLPEQERVQRLGNVVHPEEILALSGDIERGKRVFLEAAGVQCRNCHTIGGMGKEIGPDLSKVGQKFDRAKILDTILQPSKEIDPKYLVYLVQTTGGQVHTGLLVEKSDKQIVLKDAEAKLITIPADEVEQSAPQQQSLMPDLLLREMTAQQVADLTAFLSSLK